MDWGNLTDDQLDRMLVGSEGEIAALRAVQMAVIREKRGRQSHNADGYRSIVDWVAARADISHRTSRSICWTATRLADSPEVERQLAAGEITFDRAEQVARLPRDHRDQHQSYDIAQLRRLVAHHRRLTPRREKENATDGFLNFQSSLDEAATQFWGELPGIDARLVEKAVDQRADEVLESEAGLGVARRRALALVAICQDSLYSSGSPGDSPATEVVVTVDARPAARDGGETGVAVLNGPRIGRRALEEIFCNGVVDVVGIAEDGTPLSLGRRSRTVSRKLRRCVLARDMGCTVDGCPSNYRLEVHHSEPWYRGGATNADNLVTLCWYHHHVAVHQEGLQIVRIGQSRVRLKRPR
jgi:hypothetical protein